MKTSHLADKLYQLRAQKRIQQKELAAAIGVDAPMYSRIEKGTRIPKADQLEKLASILDVKLEELPTRIATSVDFANAVRNGDKQVAQITFNDDIINIVAAMLEEKTEFVQTYFANPDFQNFVNARVFQAAVSQLSSQRM